MQSISALFANAGTATEPGSPLINDGYIGGDQPAASNINFYLKLACQAAQEISNIITDAGFTPDVADFYQLEKAFIAKRHAIGETVDSEIELTPVIYSAARSTAHPSYPEYLPLIKRYDADHDVTSTMAPDLVTAYRAEVAKIRVGGTVYNSWTGTVSGSTITFATNAQNLALINLYANEAAANGFIQAQSATFSPLYTGTAQRCLRVNGVDYAVTSTSTGAYSITVSGTPASGSQTCQAPTYCIAGSTTSVRLPRISGFVGVTTQDYDGEVVAGWRRPWRTQGHVHYNRVVTSSTPGSTYTLTKGDVSSAFSQAPENTPSVLSPTSDGTNGPPQTGKTTDPRTYGKYTYTHAGRLLAAIV
jgi:hypothetical protein